MTYVTNRNASVILVPVAVYVGMGDPRDLAGEAFILKGEKQTNAHALHRGGHSCAQGRQEQWRKDKTCVEKRGMRRRGRVGGDPLLAVFSAQKQVGGR